jgi:hypothetical protein
MSVEIPDLKLLKYFNDIKMFIFVKGFWEMAKLTLSSFSFSFFEERRFLH